VPLGHRWAPDPEAVETYPVLRCERCGRRRHMGAETREKTPWTGRGISPTGRFSGRTGRDGRPY
jgi:hypothetical protein